MTNSPSQTLEAPALAWPCILAFAIGLALVYLSLSPGAIGGMGYTSEDMHAGNQILLRIAGRTNTFDMPRNGVLPLTLDLPFLAVGGLFTNQISGQDLILAVEPCILTALLVTMLLIWSYQLTGSLGYSFSIACVAAFCTMLWPYAYIGLETKQSFFLALAGFLAIGYQKPESWGAVTGFAISAAYAVGSKSTGAFLIPVVVYLIWQYGIRLTSSLKNRREIVVRILLCAFVPASAFIANSVARSIFWAHFGGSASFIKVWIANDPLSPILNFAAFFGSPNKGLWIFAPVCLLACYALPRAWTVDRRLMSFALLTTAGLAGGFCLLRNWADETWGPRYLHSTIVPLILIYVAAYPRPRFSAKFALGVAAALGLVAAFLGIMFAYTLLPIAAIRTGQNTLEGYQGDIALNHLRFNARLFSTWLHPSDNAVWSSQRQWFFEPPPDVQKPKSVDLHEFAFPQPVLIRHWATPKTGIIGMVWTTYLICLIIGFGLLGWIAWRSFCSRSLTTSTNLKLSE